MITKFLQFGGALCVALALAIGAGPAEANHSVSVESAVEVDFNGEGRAEGLRIRWTYDADTTRNLLAEHGGDASTLADFDVQWQPGDWGDTYVQIGGNLLILLDPKPEQITLSQGRLTTVHTREFEFAVDIDGEELLIQSHDPTDHKSYALVEGTVVGREDCTTDIFTPGGAFGDPALAARPAALIQLGGLRVRCGE